MKTTDKNLGISKKKQTLAEIAEQGFTVRNGHNPNKPNPLENSITDEVSGIFKDYFPSQEELDEDGNVKVTNDELDNPSEYFEDTDDVVY